VASAIGWDQKDGRPARTATSIFLRKLCESQLIELPHPLTPYYSKPERRPRTPGCEPLPKIRYRLDDLMPLTLQVVTTKKERDLWSEMIDRYHYLGYTTFTGAQVRYLVHSPQGLVAVFGFSASAWQMRDPLLTERTGHVTYFAEQLKDIVKNVIVLRGGMGKKQRQTLADLIAGIPDDEERVLIATGRYAGEGFDDSCHIAGEWRPERDVNVGDGAVAVMDVPEFEH
jgi:hypothetical protein